MRREKNGQKVLIIKKDLFIFLWMQHQIIALEKTTPNKMHLR